MTTERRAPDTDPTALALHELLGAEEALDRLKLNPLRFNVLAHQPYVGARPLSFADVEQVHLRLPMLAQDGVRHGRWAVPDVARALNLVARERPHHPVADFLNGLKWDGTPRLDRVAKEILGVEANTVRLASVVLRHWFRAAIARAHEPGTRVDGMLVLVGRPGSGPDPELFFRVLVPTRFYVDAPAGLPRQGLRQHLRQAWVIFRNDLLSLSSLSAAWLVNHLQQTDDRVDCPFASSGERAPRTTLFVAAVHALPAARDEAFDRHLWPVVVGRRINIAMLKEWRDQLWAEAVCSYRKSPELSLDPEDESSIRQTRGPLIEHDPWEDRVLGAFASLFDRDEKGRKGCRADDPTIHEIQVAMGLPTGRRSTPDQRRIAEILRINGFTPQRLRRTPFTTIWRHKARSDVAHVAHVAREEPE